MGRMKDLFSTLEELPREFTLDQFIQEMSNLNMTESQAERTLVWLQDDQNYLKEIRPGIFRIL